MGRISKNAQRKIKVSQGSKIEAQAALAMIMDSMGAKNYIYDVKMAALKKHNNNEHYALIPVFDVDANAPLADKDIINQIRTKVNKDFEKSGSPIRIKWIYNNPANGEAVNAFMMMPENKYAEIVGKRG